jgi:hypothetical protein
VDEQPLPRVFVSSIIEGFSSYRQAARKGIGKAGGYPVLVNEDFPSLPVTPRNACLDGVESCDAILTIISALGGRITPSGKFVVEEEFEHAKKLKLPRMIFLEEMPRDAETQKFVDRLSSYVDGRFRRTFRGPNHLETLVEDALSPVLKAIKKPMTEHVNLDLALAKPHEVNSEACLRLVLAPERHEELIDPVTLESDVFLDTVYSLALARNVQLLSHRRAKETTLQGSSLIIQQPSGRDRGDVTEDVRIEISEKGLVFIDANVTGLVNRGEDHFLSSMIIAQEDVELVLKRCFFFLADLFDHLDPFGRHQRFYYNVVLSNQGTRLLEKDPKPRSSYSMAMSRSENPLVIFNPHRVIGRDDLRSSDDEISRTIILIARALKQN